MSNLFHFFFYVLGCLWQLLSFLRVALLNLVFLAIVIGGYYLLSTPTTNNTTNTQVLQALTLDLNGVIVEEARPLETIESLSNGLLGQTVPQKNVLHDIVSTIRYATTDTNITGLVLQLGNMPETNLTKLRYIGKAINEFKASGKPVYAYSDFYNQSQYYLASYADKIYLSPNGDISLTGYSAYNLYFKDFLDKLKITPHIFRVGTYKSAVEPFLRNDMSAPAKESASLWLTQLWSAYVDDVASNRQIEPKVLTPTMDEYLAQLKTVKGHAAALYKKLGLVDELFTRHQANLALGTEFGRQDDRRYRQISYYQYKQMLPLQFTDNKPSVAVVVASGTILDGEQPKGQIGGDTTVRLLQAARLDKNVKAVVLRIDSPGGSAFASEVIRNEVEALKRAGKPVVASMSSMAASGGYWIAMSANEIIAQPTTLTGSIGIFGVLATFEQGLNTLGIHTDGVGTTPFSGSGLTNGLSDGMAQVIQMNIEYGYQNFISLVSKNRNLSLKEVDNIAQGRVWTGQDALNNGLVDQLGDFDDAIKLAGILANISDPQLIWISDPLNPTQALLENWLRSAQVSVGHALQSVIPPSWLPVTQELSAQVELLQSLNDPKGAYAFCLTCSVNQ